MQHDSGYSALMKVLMTTAAIGAALAYGDVYLFHLVLALVLLRNLIVTEPGTLFDPSPLPSAYHRFFVFMTAWFVLGLAWSWDRVYTLQYSGYIAIGASLGLLILKYVGTSLRRFEDLFSIAKIVFLVDIAIGLLETFTPFRLPSSPFSEHNPHWEKLAGASVEQIELLTSSPTGFHWNPNNYALVMILLLPFFLLHKQSLVRLAGLSVICTLTCFAGSRANLAALVFVLLLVPIYFRKTILWLVVSGTLAFSSYLVLNDVFANYAYIENAKLREAAGTIVALREYLIPEMEREAVSSVGYRRALVINGLEALRKSRGLGIGGGADKLVQEQYGEEIAYLTSMHNFWIELLVNGGIPFFIPFLLWYGKMTYELWRYSRNLPPHSMQRYYCGALSLAMVGFVPGCISCSSAIYVLPFYILLGMAIAMINICRNVADAEIAEPDHDLGTVQPHLPYCRNALKSRLSYR